MIELAQLSKLSVFGIELKTGGIPLIVVYLTCTFLYYRFMSLFVFYETVEEALREGYYQCFYEYHSTGLTDLTIYPSLDQIENAFVNLEEDEKSFMYRILARFQTTLTWCLMVGPLVATLWASYVLIRSPVTNAYLSIPAVCVSSVILIRAAIFIVQQNRVVCGRNGDKSC